MDAITLLERDHREVERLFAEFESRSEPEARRAILDRMIQELSVHAAIEEEILYPELRSVVRDGGSLADEGIEEHQKAKELLHLLGKMTGREPEFESRVGALILDVSRHVQEEENEFFPRLREAMSANALIELGKRLEAAKGHAPTRPHPKAPSTPPANKLVGPPAAAVDRLRDKVEGRESV